MYSNTKEKYYGTINNDYRNWFSCSVCRIDVDVLGYVFQQAQRPAR